MLMDALDINGRSSGRLLFSAVTFAKKRSKPVNISPTLPAATAVSAAMIPVEADIAAPDDEELGSVIAI
jgi:hypothetical protein